MAKPTNRRVMIIDRLLSPSVMAIAYLLVGFALLWLSLPAIATFLGFFLFIIGLMCGYAGAMGLFTAGLRQLSKHYRRSQRS